MAHRHGDASSSSATAEETSSLHENICGYSLLTDQTKEPTTTDSIGVNNDESGNNISGGVFTADDGGRTREAGLEGGEGGVMQVGDFHSEVASSTRSTTDPRGSLHECSHGGTHDDLRTSIAGVLGNTLEWYDFSVFGYFSDVIGDVFFPPNQAGNRALIESFVVFGAAFLVRPLGGIVLGIMGDTVGRNSALRTSIFLMALPTFALGCLPSYERVGWVATVLLILCRLLQGLSVGGQLMTSVVFTLERTHVSKWGLWGSSVFAASSLGVTLGSLFSYILRESLDADQLQSWGWRIPFLFGICGIVPGLYLKRHSKKCHHNTALEGLPVGFEGGEELPVEQRNVLKEAFRKDNRRALASAFLVPSMPAATYYIIMIWMAIDMETLIEPPVPHAFAINSVNGVLGGIVLATIGGWIADLYKGAKSHLMIMSGICLAISCPLLLHFVGKGDPVVAFLSQLTMSFFLGVYCGAMIPWMVAKFPATVRITSVGFGYNIAVSTCGGFSPALATVLVDRFNNSSPGFIVSVLVPIALFGLWIAPRRNPAIMPQTHANESPTDSDFKADADQGH